MSDKEFSLKLYDKLWENIIHKENRLWTFLSVYGAAIGVAIGAGLTESLLQISTFVILVLTYWAGELIIDTDWWSIRNRLMIGQVEKKFAVEIQNVIPSCYKDIKYSTSSLYNVSLYVFATIGFTVLSYNILLLVRNVNQGANSVVFSASLYFIWSLILIRWTHVRESRIKEYIQLYKTLNSDYQVTEANLRDGHRCSFRAEVAIAHIMLAIWVTYLVAQQRGMSAVCYFVICELILILVFCYAWFDYQQNHDHYWVFFQKNPIIAMNWSMLLLLTLSSVSAYFGLAPVSEQKSQYETMTLTRLQEAESSAWSELSELSALIDRLEDERAYSLEGELEAIRHSIQEIQKKLNTSNIGSVDLSNRIVTLEKELEKVQRAVATGRRGKK